MIEVIAHELLQMAQRICEDVRVRSAIAHEIAQPTAQHLDLVMLAHDPRIARFWHAILLARQFRSMRAPHKRHSRDLDPDC